MSFVVLRRSFHPDAVGHGQLRSARRQLEAPPDVPAPPFVGLDAGVGDQGPTDRDGPPIHHLQATRDRRATVQDWNKAKGLVERRGGPPSVGNPGTAFVLRRAAKLEPHGAGAGIELLPLDTQPAEAQPLAGLAMNLPLRLLALVGGDGWLDHVHLFFPGHTGRSGCLIGTLVSRGPRQLPAGRRRRPRGRAGP